MNDETIDPRTVTMDRRTTGDRVNAFSELDIDAESYGFTHTFAPGLITPNNLITLMTQP